MPNDSETPAMSQGRGLLTESEREALAGNASESYRYKTRSYFRDRLEMLADDVEVLEEHDYELLEELRDVVCEDDIATSGSSEEILEDSSQPDQDDVVDQAEEPAEATAEIEAEGERGVLVEDVREWLEGRPPKTSHGREAVLTVFSLLRERGTMKTGELKAELWEDYSDDYSSERAMWESVSRYLEDVPGVEKGGYGEWTYSGDENVRRQLSGETDE